MIKRENYLSKIRPFYESDLIKVIVGIRRSGKSVILNQIKDEIKDSGVNENHIIFINFEDMSYDTIKNDLDLYNYVEKRVTDEKKYYLFFDEIQNVKHFEKAINSFRATKNVSIFITGSNSKLLSGELATLLSGRYVSFTIQPFSFKEVCQLKGIQKDEITDELLLDFIKWGGMPQRFAMKTEPEIKIFLTDLYNSIVLKDIVQRANVKDIALLNRIIDYLISTPSQLFSAKSISAFMKSEGRTLSKETLYNYLEYITTSFVMSKAGRYDLKGKKKLSTLEKYYLMDLGLGRVRTLDSSINLGASLENIVYNELVRRGYEVYVGKIDDGEIDFVVNDMNEKFYVQVAYLLADEKIVEREFGAFKNVGDNYPKYVISMDKWNFSKDGIIHKNIVDFLME